MIAIESCRKKNLVECCKAEDLDAHLVRPQNGKLDLLVDAVPGKRQKVLQPPFPDDPDCQSTRTVG
jgi:hypothetical protein